MSMEVIFMVINVNVIADRIIRAMEEHNKKTKG